MSDPRKTLEIRIGNLTEAQAIAIEDLLATWLELSSMGASRFTSFFADGDGNFHPKITVDGEKPTLTPLLTTDERWGKANVDALRCGYAIDFDIIAWRLRDTTRSDEAQP